MFNRNKSLLHQLRRRFLPFLLLGAVLASAILFSSSYVTHEAHAQSIVRYDNLPDAAQFVVIDRRWNHHNLTYFFQNNTPDIPNGNGRQAVREAFWLWSNVTSLTFTEVSSAAWADIVIVWAAGAHGDNSPFDGVNGVLAHAFYPPPEFGPVDGDVHFDEAETWTLNTRSSVTQPIDLLTVAAHEIGHSLGLAHSSVPQALMYPFYNGSHRFLDQDDVLGIRSLYPDYDGWVDVADCNSIIGWAADRARPNTPITVGIYDGSNLVTTVTANASRPDVGSYVGDNGLHGFAIPTPGIFKDGMAHNLRVRFESSTIELNSSPQTIQCGGQATYYEIVARHSGKCLDVEGESMAMGARVIQFGCGGWANQQWQIVDVGGGFSKIVARHSGLVLDVQWGALGNGTPVWQWEENGTPAQQWEIIDVVGGYKRIMARHSNKALDVAGGFFDDLTQIHQWDYVGVANQQWLLRPVP